MSQIVPKDSIHVYGTPYCGSGIIHGFTASFPFGLNFGWEAGAANARVLRTRIVQGSQHIQAAELWYFGNTLGDILPGTFTP